MDRRLLLRAAGGLSLGAALAGIRPAIGATTATLKISHQFPGGTATDGDFRDRLCRRFASEIERRTNGALTFEIYPNSSLMKTNAQFSAMRKGALDMSLIPLNYAGGEVPEVNIGLMPGLVNSYQIGTAWKNAEVGTELASVLADKGIVIISWIWQAGGVASRSKPLVAPADAQGMKVRGGSREMDLILKAAGASVVTTPSNEIYAAMQTGAVDAAMTSSTSLISFRLEEVAKALTTGGGTAYWFMFEPLMMSRSVFDSLTSGQQQAVKAVGAEMEAFALQAAQLDDLAVAAVFTKAGAKVVALTEPVVREWQQIGRDTAWKDYAERGPGCARLLTLAQKLL
jgi:TRAP-type C4-dicarboxylate transport system substrate-binding protein